MGTESRHNLTILIIYLAPQNDRAQGLTSPYGRDPESEIQGAVGSQAVRLTKLSIELIHTASFMEEF